MQTITKIVLAVAFSLMLVSANAQRPLYKEIQKVSQRSEKEIMVRLTSVGYPVQTVSKDVQRIGSSNAGETTPGNIVSGNYPQWTISKGVHRIKKIGRRTDSKSIPLKK